MDHRRDQLELIQILRAHLPELRQRFSVRALALFGSYARGEAGEESDVDLLVEFERVPGLIAFVELEQYLSDLLGVKVDLVLKDALRPTIGQRILKELVPV
ncbi:MAG: nucleotidyltransferase family protein [Candidatus Dormibacteraceae bacterium]